MISFKEQDEERGEAHPQYYQEKENYCLKNRSATWKHMVVKNPLVTSKIKKKREARQHGKSNKIFKI